MVGEKREKKNLFVTFWLFRKPLTTLEHDTFIHLGWEIFCLIVNRTSLKVFSQFLGISFGSIVTKPSAVSLCVQENSSNETIHLQNICHPCFDHPWVSPCQYIFKTWSMISCCGLSYDGSLSIDDSSLSRNLIQKSSVPWKLHASMAGFSPLTTGCIIVLRSNDSMTCSTSAHSFTFHGLY